MIIYAIMFIFIYCVCYLGNQKRIEVTNNDSNNYIYSDRVSTGYIILIWTVPVFFIGMRTNFIDTKGYIEGFLNINGSFEKSVLSTDLLKGPLWSLYVWIVRKFTSNANIYLLITACIQSAMLSKTYRKYSPDVGYSVLLFFLSCSFVNMMNGIRQFLAVCLILYIFPYYVESKKFRFFIGVILAALIHFSAIIWIPAFFIVDGKPFKRKSVIAILGTLSILLFLDRFTTVIDVALSDTSYSGYINQFSIDDGSNIFHTLIALVPVIIAFIYRKSIYSLDNQVLDCLINVSIFGSLVSLIANFTSGILIGRIPIYFTIFNFVTLPWMFVNMVDEKNRKLFRFFCTVGYVLYAIYYIRIMWGVKGMPYISNVLGINTWQ